LRALVVPLSIVRRAVMLLTLAFAGVVVLVLAMARGQATSVSPGAERALRLLPARR
jgi:hypothetical protein